MTKRQLRKSMPPIVLISFNDHSADLAGEAAPAKFVAVGILLKETPEGYSIGHWHRVDTVETDDNVTTFIAKVRGMSIKTLGHLKVPHG